MKCKRLGVALIPPAGGDAGVCTLVAAMNEWRVTNDM